jgi:YD repeat-containing protein
VAAGATQKFGPYVGATRFAVVAIAGVVVATTGVFAEDNPFAQPGAGGGVSALSAATYDGTTGLLTSETVDGVMWTYTYDANNRVATRSNGVTTQTAVYDGSGRLTSFQ